MCLAYYEHTGYKPKTAEIEAFEQQSKFTYSSSIIRKVVNLSQ